MATLIAGLLSLMIWEMPAGTDGGGVVLALGSAGASASTATGGLQKLEKILKILKQRLRAVVEKCLPCGWERACLGRYDHIAHRAKSRRIRD